MRKLNLSEEQKKEILLHINDVKTSYKSAMWSYMKRMREIHEEASTFRSPKSADWHTDIKVNKMHEIENKVNPKLIANNPKRLVSNRITNVGQDVIQGGEEKYKEIVEMALAIQDFLTMIFDKQDMKESIRLWSKGMVKYGNSRAKVVYKYNINRRAVPVNEDVVDEQWNIIWSQSTYDIIENVIDEWPSVEIKNITDIYYDPRYIRFEDMPAIIDTTRWVRLSALKSKKGKYMDLDKLEQICNLKWEWDTYKKQMQQISWVAIMPENKITKNDITLECYYWLYDLKDGDERLYEFHVAGEVVLIYAAEITHIPFEDIKCFDDTETHLSTGYLEPIVGIQKEMNHKKNAVAISINQAINRTMIWSPQSWINPSKGNSAPWAIIVTTRSWQDALANYVEMPFRPIPGEYFSEQNDIERQIQAATHTIDASTPRSNQGLTQTATGIKVKEFESNSVTNETRTHLEEWLERLAYKLLQVAAENMTDNIKVPKTQWIGYWEINKEALLDAINKYEIRVEAWSSSYDTIEKRREEAIAKKNIALEFAQAGVQVDLEKVFKDVMSTFEWVDADSLIAPKAQIGQPSVIPWAMQPQQIPNLGMPQPAL